MNRPGECPAQQLVGGTHAHCFAEEPRRSRSGDGMVGRMDYRAFGICLATGFIAVVGGLDGCGKMV